RELQPFIQECKLPFRLFDELIQGCESDLETTRYQNQEQLDLYCYRVASVVGLLSIEIFGYTNPACREYAIHLGKALQLTNILRDVRSDAERGRIYLPLDALQQHRVSEGEILRHAYSDRFRALAESMAGLARDHYATAQRLLPPEDRRSMAAAELMGSVYWKLLCKLHARGFDVLGPQRLGLGKIQKLGLIARTWWRATTGSVSPSYGD
ncbi:MAG: squalene synthase HpnD, partial [Verrucomicrobia bacterium]|nr:squalene synthase HpnD [Verrucomicrobiota bacterium]